MHCRREVRLYVAKVTGYMHSNHSSLIEACCQILSIFWLCSRWKKHGVETIV